MADELNLAALRERISLIKRTTANVSDLQAVLEFADAQIRRVEECETCEGEGCPDCGYLRADLLTLQRAVGKATV